MSYKTLKLYICMCWALCNNVFDKPFLLSFQLVLKSGLFVPQHISTFDESVAECCHTSPLMKALLVGNLYDAFRCFIFKSFIYILLILHYYILVWITEQISQLHCISVGYTKLCFPFDTNMYYVQLQVFHVDWCTAVVFKRWAKVCNACFFITHKKRLRTS